MGHGLEREGEARGARVVLDGEEGGDDVEGAESRGGRAGEGGGGLSAGFIGCLATAVLLALGAKLVGIGGGGGFLVQ